MPGRWPWQHGAAVPRQRRVAFPAGLALRHRGAGAVNALLRFGRVGAAFAFLVLLVCLVAPTPAAAEPSCPVRAPRVRLAVLDKPVEITGTQSIDAMHAESGERRTAQRHHLALTTSRVEWHSELNAHVSRHHTGRGRVCAVPAEVVLTLVEAQHRISIAAEVPANGCLWQAVLAHERRHAEANRNSLGVAARTARAAANGWAERASGHGATEEAAMARLQAGLRRAIEPSLAAMRAARARAHARIDTPAEYRRLSAICPADQARLATRLRNASGD